MLNFTLKPGEYFNIGDNIRVVITGGTKNNYHVMVDAPRELNIVRGKVLEKNAKTEEEKQNLKHYYPDAPIPAEEMKRIMARQKAGGRTQPKSK